MRYFLSLGSNLGNKRKNLEQGLALLAQGGAKILRASSVYRTQPVGHENQPWFYNQVVEVNSSLNPCDLLRLIKKIEERLGRKPTRASGPRPIDIDILLAEHRIIQTERLIIPHPRMQKRNFVLMPLNEISPGTEHPLLKKKLRELWKNSGDSAAVRKLRALETERGKFRRIGKGARSAQGLG